MKQPLMPMATAVWLVEHTALTFEQIADFCGLHPLEVQSIADEQIAANIIGLDPVANGQISWADIERCQNNPADRLTLKEDEVPAKTRAGGPRYTPVSKRQDRPDAIAWLLRHHPEVSDAQICKLVGTTKSTIGAIRDRSHWNMSNIKPVDPVALGICRQLDLDAAIAKGAETAARAAEDKQKKAAKLAEAGE
jgi:hypothetical protein